MKTLKELQVLLDGFLEQARGLNEKLSEAKQFMQEIIGEQSPAQIPISNLSTTERQILTRIAKGFRSAQIAKDLKLSRRTIEVNRYNIRKKLGLTRKQKLEEVAKTFGLS